MGEWTPRGQCRFPLHLRRRPVGGRNVRQNVSVKGMQKWVDSQSAIHARLWSAGMWRLYCSWIRWGLLVPENKSITQVGPDVAFLHLENLLKTHLNDKSQARQPQQFCYAVGRVVRLDGTVKHNGAPPSNYHQLLLDTHY